MRPGLPQFFIIGAAKAGTTSIYDALAAHPDVFLSRLKEPEFFSRDAVYERGFDWYGSLFAEAAEGRICGEASTTYSRWPHTADVPMRIAEKVPSARFIYILRHPVERAFSHYCHHMRERVTMTFEEALARDSIFVDCSLYHMQIERYLRFFDRNAFHCLLLDDFRRDAGLAMNGIERFLGIAEGGSRVKQAVHSNERHQEFIRSRTTRLVRRLPLGNRIADAIPRNLRQRIHGVVRQSPLGRALERRHGIPKMLPETRSLLLERFREDTLKMQDFLKRNLSDWLI